MSKPSIENTKQKADETFSISTRIFGFIIGEPNKANVFTELDFYISKKLMVMNLFGCNITNEISKYKIEYKTLSGHELMTQINEKSKQLFNLKVLQLEIQNFQVFLSKENQWMHLLNILVYQTLILQKII